MPTTDTTDVAAAVAAFAEQANTVWQELDRLSGMWDDLPVDYREANDDFARGYPFNAPLDEVAANLGAWVETLGDIAEQNPLLKAANTIRAQAQGQAGTNTALASLLAAIAKGTDREVRAAAQAVAAYVLLNRTRPDTNGEQS